MRIAILDVARDPRSRATTIARVVRLIDAAAGDEPPPDVVVVPAGCDGASGAAIPPSVGLADTYRETLAAKANEWGVYVVAANRWVDPHRVMTRPIVLDPDGDVIAGWGAPAPVGSPGSETVWAETVMGLIGVSCGGGETHPRVPVGGERRCCVVSMDVPAAFGSSGTLNSGAGAGEGHGCGVRVHFGAAMDGSAGLITNPGLAATVIHRREHPPAGTVFTVEDSVNA
ncbi:MAG: hypothetical protein HOP29_08870 [Phycisphaerales bacterium]|nr:hypothetical protein [Phycisphaerales bacterium]